MKNLISRVVSAITQSGSTRRRRKSQPVGEALENRTLLSNVTVTFQNGDLRLEGDSGDNTVTVEQRGGRIIVQGLNGTDLNGRPQSLLFATNGVPDDLIMNFQAGGENIVAVAGVDVGDDVQFRGGRDTDRIGFVRGSVGDDMRIRTGNGHDSVLVDSSPVGDLLDVNSGSGNDKVGVGGDGMGVRDLTIKTGRGRDGIIFGAMQVQDDVNVNAGSGNDAAFVGELGVDASGSVRLNLSGGNDDLYMFDSQIDAPMSVNGGSGTDAVEIQNTVFAQNPSLNSIERNFVQGAEGRAVDLALCLFDEFDVL